MIAAVIFDMDGVIIDSELIHQGVELKLFRELGLNISAEEHNLYVGTPNRDMWKDFAGRYNLRRSVEDLIKLNRKRYMEHLLSLPDIKPIPGVVDLIDEIHKTGLKVALASSSSVEEIRTVLKLFRLDTSFHEVVSGDYVEKGKPSPDIFILTAERLGLKPEECVVIEDSKNGVSAAKTAGMKCVGFYNPNSRNQDLSQADIVINSFNELSISKLLCI